MKRSRDPFRLHVHAWGYALLVVLLAGAWELLVRLGAWVAGVVRG